MKAVLLAAGFGTRMLPLTRSIPKAVLPVLGRPLALQILQVLAAGGVEEVAVNAHHLPDQLRGALGPVNMIDLPRLQFSHEEVILGTGGGIRQAAQLLDDNGPLIACNSDSLTEIDIEAVLETHHNSGNLATLVLAPHRPGYSMVEVDDRGQVLSLAGKPQADPTRVADGMLFTGFQILERSVLQRLPAAGPSNIVNDLYLDLAAEGLLGSYRHEGFWWEFGSPELYLEGSFVLLDRWEEGAGQLFYHDPVSRLDLAVAAIGAGAMQHEEARFKGRIALGMATHVSEGAFLADTIVMPESWIGPRSKLRCVIVAQGVELPADFQAEHALICNDDDPVVEHEPPVERVGELLIYSMSPIPRCDG